MQVPPGPGTIEILTRKAEHTRRHELVGGGLRGNAGCALEEGRRVHLSISILVLVFASALNTFGQTSEVESRPSVIHGTAVNSVTHDPIGRALVYSQDSRYATLTDSEGHFEFSLAKAEGGSDGQRISEERIWLVGRKPGFLEGQNGSRPVEAWPGAEVTIPLVPEALIKGRATLGAVDPGHGVNVQLYYKQVIDGSPRWILKNAAVTNSNGEFRFAELEPGSYKVFTSEYMDNDPATATQGGNLSGFPPVYYPSATDFAGGSTIQLRAGGTEEADMALVRQPYYPVRIPVVSGEQIQGLNIIVSLQGQRGPGYSLGYNRLKSAIEGQLPNGKYVVEATNFAKTSASGSVNLMVAGAAGESPAMVLAGNISIPVDVKEEFTSAQIPGSATWSDGTHTFALHGPRVDLQISASAVEEFAQHKDASVRPPTREDDSLVLENLAPGRYWLRLRTNRGYVASATMGGTDLLREPLVVVPGASGTINITTRDDNAELEGTVTGSALRNAGGASDSPGDSVSSYPASTNPSAYVYCIPLPDNPGQYEEIPASADGKFDDQAIMPGVYRVIAFDRQQSQLPYRDAEAMKAYETKGQVVHLAPGQKVSVELQATVGSE